MANLWSFSRMGIKTILILQDEMKDHLGLEKYRKAGYIVKVVKLCPNCLCPIEAVIGGKKKGKGLK